VADRDTAGVRASRARDLDDVIQLVRTNDLDRGYAEKLDPYVRRKFLEPWAAAQARDEY